MCPPGYHHNGCGNSCTWAHDVYIYINSIYIFIDHLAVITAMMSAVV